MATECDTKLILVNEIVIPKYLYIEPAMMLGIFYMSWHTNDVRTQAHTYIHTTSFGVVFVAFKVGKKFLKVYTNRQCSHSTAELIAKGNLLWKNIELEFHSSIFKWLNQYYIAIVNHQWISCCELSQLFV